MIYKKLKLLGGSIYVLQSEEEHQKGDTVLIPLKWGGDNERIICKSLGNDLYSLEPNGKSREKKENKQAKYSEWSGKNAVKSAEAYTRSNKDSDFLSLGEPIKIGHHSEGKHRRIIEQGQNNMRKCVELSDKAEEQASKVEGIQDQLDKIIYLDDFNAIEMVTAKINKLEKAKHQAVESYVKTNLNARLRKEKQKKETLEKLYI